MFYISFCYGEDILYLWADTDEIEKANEIWFEHVTTSQEYAPFHLCARDALYEPLLMQDETAVWSLGLFSGEGEEVDVLLGYAVGPIQLSL
ncbi:MAG: hypothetical protein AAF170_16705 [Bacteroidota bacterium]